jgi:DNA-binding NarL/FixJ family response regulator
MSTSPTPPTEPSVPRQYVPAVADQAAASAPTIRVLVVDDHDVMRFGLNRLLDSQEGIEVCGTAENGATAVTMADDLLPDVILMDVSMPVLDGVSATRAILRDHPAVRVLVLTSYRLETVVRSAMAAGAAGYLLKDCPPDVLVDSVRRVFRGERPMAPSVRTPL